MQIKQQLEEAQTRATIVRIHRDGLEDGWVDGYVVALGRDFFALEVFDKAGRLDGYNCLRCRDISNLLSPAPHAHFLAKALLARRAVRNASFDLDIGSLPTLLRSAGRTFPLVSVFYEGDDSVCYIGKVMGVTEQEIRLLEITPDAQFEVAPTTHLLGGISRVDFGGSYEEALNLVSGAN